MDSTDNKKILTVSFMSAGALAGVLAEVLMSALSAIWGVAAKFLTQDLVAHGVPVAVGLITFLIFQFNPKILSWADEVATEIRKVVWPSRKDTVAMTVAVVVMVLISAVILALIDVTSSKFIQWLVHL